jgi:hypothetical protein
MRVLIRGQRYRATIPAIEAVLGLGNCVVVDCLEVRAGSVFRAAQIAAAGSPDGEGGWTIYLTRPPPEVERVSILQRIPDGEGSIEVAAIRLHDEPPFPGEWYGGDGWAWAEWIPCPGPRGHPCGSVLLWAEAGYVPGWRFCLRGHFAFLRAAARVGPETVTYEGRIHESSQYPRRPRVVYEE